MKFSYRGYLNTKHSWSLVGTQLMLALKEIGHDIVLESSNGIDRIDPSIIPYLGKTSPDDYHITYTIPPNLVKTAAKRKIHIYNYETTIMPNGWADLMNKYTDLILPSSVFMRNVFTKNGVNKDKMCVLPHGVNTALYNPTVAPAEINDKFKFLIVGIPHVRKGYDILLQAFAEEFASSEPVCLVIKTDKKSDPRKRHHYEIDIMQEIARVQQNASTPEITLISGEYDSLAGLYNACDCYVSPTRSEGFGMTMLEALACKKPVISTGYGGHLDYLDTNNSYLLNYKIVPAIRGTQYWHYSDKATIAQPDKEHLKQLMRHIYNNREEAKKKAEKGYNKVVSRYTWKNVAEQFTEFVEKQNWDPKSFSPVYDDLIDRANGKTEDTITEAQVQGVKDKVSIVIPAYNKSELTIKCVDSVLRNTRGDYQIIIIDNGSSGAHLKALSDRYSRKNNIVCLHNKENRGFAKACNAGILAAEGEYVLLLNNDTEIFDPDWLTKLKGTLNNKVWLTGVAGGILDENLDYVRETRSSEDPIDYISGWCLMFKKSLIQKMGAISEEFGKAFFEDTDFAFRVRQLGGELGLTEDIKITHLNHATAKEMNLRETYVAAREIFKKKWLKKDFKEWLKRDNLPLISILTLTHNGYDLIKDATESILRNTRYPNWEWLIADNGSDDKTVEYLTSLNDPRIKVIARGTNEGNFASINNELAKVAKGKYLTFLNNDVIVTENWLSHIAYIIDKDEDVGCVGSRLLYPDGRIQHCGVIFQVGNKYPGHLYLGVPQGQVLSFLEQDREFQSVTAACSIVRKEEFEKIGMFDEEYDYVFEDVDLCLKLKKELGKRMIYAANSILYHVESATREEGMDKTKAEEHQRIWPFLIKLMDKWKDSLDGDVGHYYKNVNAELYRKKEQSDKVLIKASNRIELSFVTCVSDREQYEKNVVASLNNSDVKNFEIIPIYNDGNKYSAAQALNIGIEKAKANIVVTCHQDVIFVKDFTLRLIEKAVKYPNFGTLGIAGLTFDERTAGGVQFRNGYKFATYPEAEVKINDELLIALRKDSGLRFDEETFKGFHFYGADLCLQAIDKGLKNYAVDCHAVHLSVDGAGDMDELRKNYFPNLVKLRDKWVKKISRVWLTSGIYDGDKVHTWIPELQDEEIKWNKEPWK